MKYKSLISSFINSGYGLGGMFYVLMYYLLEDWRYVFIVSVCITVISGIIIHILYNESLAHSLMKKDYKQFYNSLVYMAKKNNRLKEFEEGIAQNEEYKQCLEQLKSYTISNKNEEESNKNNEDIKSKDKSLEKEIESEKKITFQKNDELLQIKDNVSNRSNNIDTNEKKE